MVHSRHEGPPGTILYDNCDECTSRRHDLASLDRSKLEQLLSITVKGHFPSLPTNNDRNIQSTFWHALLGFERLTGVPWQDMFEHDIKRVVPDAGRYYAYGGRHDA